MTPLMIFAFNHPSGKAAIYGELDINGAVTFAVQAARDSPIRGTELFHRMMLAFGDDAKVIHGVWRKGVSPSANIDEVNHLTANGMLLEDAVQHTWTVTRARKFGFARVRVIGHVGHPGAYREIDVLIEK